MDRAKCQRKNRSEFGRAMARLSRGVGVTPLDRHYPIRLTFIRSIVGEMNDARKHPPAMYKPI